ncbi:MAG: glycosyltransferase family 2 protein [Firmicutes bacterium]|nr:glycosyltransferase family 2 protein [Bacillota bacterium]
MLLSVVVPCYNEEEALPYFKAKFDAVVSLLPDVAFELLLVDDGSRDGTLALARRYAVEDERVIVLSFARNFGKEAALLAGLAHAKGDLVSVMDADLQDPPELLADMLQMMRETGCDCVATRRVTRAGEPPVRSFFARGFYRVINRFSAVQIVDGARDFRLMTREMADAIVRLPERRRFSKGLFAWVGFDTRYLEYENIERVAGVTKWSFWGLFRYALEGIISLTVAPLFISFVLGAACALGCAALLCFGAWLEALLCGLAALILTGIGVLGMVLARVFEEVKGRPVYILKEEKDKLKEEKDKE